MEHPHLDELELLAIADGEFISRFDNMEIQPRFPYCPSRLLTAIAVQ